ncbi:MAG: hypothetical protein DMG76_37160 [Acidobacteria bacterium]|nr:MAG: hypothetical protein DMG76_37160 [Acidobacteriota bacterium]
MVNAESFKCGTRSSLLPLIIVSALFLISVGVFAQTTISTGSIVGTVADPTGAVVIEAKVLITNKGTGQIMTPKLCTIGTVLSWERPLLS